MSNETITISKKEYEELLSAKQKLIALESAGVDNWQGYGEAMQEFYEEEDYEDRDSYGDSLYKF